MRRRFKVVDGDVVETTGAAREASLGVQANSYDNGEGGIKLWSQAPWNGPGPDPRGFTQHDADGVPVVSGRREIDEVQGRTSYGPDPLVWSRDF